MAISVLTISVHFVTFSFSKVMGKFRLVRHRKHERHLQRQLRDACALLVRIPCQNIVITASPGLSVAVLLKSLDVDLLVC